MNQYLEINDGNFIHLSMVKRLRHVSEKERVSLASLGKHVDANKFNTRIDRTDGTKSYAQESVDEITTQGIPLVQVENDAFVPRDNIIQAKNISQNDRENYLARTGRPMRDDFKASLDTTAGRILATVDSRTVRQRMNQPYKTHSVNPQQHVDTDMGTLPSQQHDASQEAYKNKRAQNGQTAQPRARRREAP